MGRMDGTFVAGAIYALGLIAQCSGDDQEIQEALDEMDFLPEPVTRDGLIALGADIYDAEQVMACLEQREPEEV